jgi:hypothetical protein
MQFLYYFWDPPVFVMLLIGDEWLFGDMQVGQKLAGVTGILGGNDVNTAKHMDGSQCYVLQVTDWSGDNK